MAKRKQVEEETETEEAAGLAEQLEGDAERIEAAAGKPSPRRLTADDIRKGGYVAKERPSGPGDPGKVCIITKGNVKLFFPGDEEKAGALTIHQLDGTVPPSSAPKTFLGQPVQE